MSPTVRELFDLRGRTALVTGGASGLGLAMAKALAEAGASVALASRREELCKQKAQELSQATGASTLGVRMDVASRTEVKGAFETVLKEFEKLDILIVNAGISGVGEAVSLPPEEWAASIDTNLAGAFWCAQAASASMIPRRSGNIVTIASIYGFLATDGRLYCDPGQAPLENPAFAASKGGLIQLTRSLAGAWARHGIRVNCISPGGFLVERLARRLGPDRERFTKIWAEKTPLGRMGDPDDLKGAVLFLASDASKYVTGQNLTVDGGWSLW